MAAAAMTGCASSTLIDSSPRGATVYLNGERVGVTPHQHRDRKITGARNTVLLRLDGYRDFTAEFSRDEEVSVGAVIGGVFLLFPFLWTMEYKPSRLYELTPATEPAR